MLHCPTCHVGARVGVLGVKTRTRLYTVFGFHGICFSRESHYLNILQLGEKH